MRQNIGEEKNAERNSQPIGVMSAMPAIMVAVFAAAAVAVVESAMIVPIRPGDSHVCDAEGDSYWNPMHSLHFSSPRICGRQEINAAARVSAQGIYK
jgi:hypothetical protein